MSSFTPKKQIDTRAIDVLLSGTRDQRLFLCSLDPKYFAIYYFHEYFIFKSPLFHFDFYDDCRRLLDGEDPLNEVMWKAYRDSAKTSIAKIAFLTWSICFKKKKYINVDSYDKENSEALLFDVTLSLQTNKRIIADFGHLYYRKSKKPDEEEEGSKMKRLGSFVTENDIKVEAHSTQESTRGRLYKSFRPDLYLIDDFENLKTIESPAVMAKIKAHIDELRAGLASDASVLYLGNVLIEDGVVGYISDLLKKNPDTALSRNIPVVDRNGVVSWPAKYVKTDLEALEKNKLIIDPRKRVISLESKRRQLGDAVYAREMMNDPGAAGDYIFDRNKILRDLNHCFDPIKVIGGMKIFVDVLPDHKYGNGADTAEGKGNDANASVITDFTRRPNAMIATYEDNKIGPNTFGKVLAAQGFYYNEALVCPELNNTGWATVAILQEEYENIYVKEDKTKVKNQMGNEYGLRKTAGNKSMIISGFADSYRDGEVDIFDKDLLMEMYHYTKNDLLRMNTEDGMTRHFDKLQAAAISWFLKNDVLFGKKDLRPGEKPKPNPFKSQQKKWTGLIG